MPVATETVLGGVKIGANIAIIDGMINVASPYVLPAAAAGSLGGVKPGSNVTIAVDGTISVAAPYTLPVANTVTLGGVKAGVNVSIAGDGSLSVATPYVLTTATASALGGVKIGDNISIIDGIISVAAPYVLPTASNVTKGGIKVGNNLSVDGGGFLNVDYTITPATTSTIGGIRGLVGDNILLGTRGDNYSAQGFGAVGVGDNAGNSSQGAGAVAVGQFAGAENQGTNSIAIGLAAGQINQPNATIILNATGVALNPATTSALYINPVRKVTTNNVMYYNTSTKEVSQGPFVLGNYTVATLSTLSSTATGSMVFVFDAPGGGQPCFFNGTSWKTILGATI